MAKRNRQRMPQGVGVFRIPVMAMALLAVAPAWAEEPTGAATQEGHTRHSIGVAVFRAEGAIPAEIPNLVGEVVVQRVRDRACFGRVVYMPEVEAMLTLEKQKQLMDCNSNSNDSLREKLDGYLQASSRALHRQLQEQRANNTAPRRMHPRAMCPTSCLT